MAQQVVMGASMMCTGGVAPSSLVVIRPKTNSSKMCAGNIMDFAPVTNIPPFGMCTLPANPAVAAATSAAMGVLTPMPCVPVTVAPWTPGNPKCLVEKFPALTNTSKCMCAWGGQISITVAGQVKHNTG